MSESGAIVSITEPIEIELVDDRIHFTCISGKRRTTYSLSFHKARGACHLTLRLLDRHDRAAAAKIASFHQEGARKGV